MYKQRIYIDTSVFGGCFDEEFQEWSNKLFDEFKTGNKIAVISPTTVDELKDAPEIVRNKLFTIPENSLEVLILNDDIEILASEYIKNNAVSPKFLDDATHIAFASYYKIDVLVSWNFRHIVNINRIRNNSINLSLGYSIIDIRTPREVLSDEE